MNTDKSKQELVDALVTMTDKLNELSETAVEYEKLNGFPNIANANDLAALVARDTANALTPVVGLLVKTVVALLDAQDNA